MNLSERTKLEQIEGFIFDIQRYSLHDGPGLHTNVFFKGCPLRCRWCANPESLRPQPEITLFAGQCINCGQFAESCPVLWQQNGLKERVEVFQERITLCPTEWPPLERLLPYLDHILWDLKHVDDDIHRKFTGVSNQRILANLLRLSELDAPLTLRIPLIPDFNASTESISCIAEFVQQLPGGAKRVDLLPYHTLGKLKYAALQRSYPWEAFQRLTEAEVETLAKIFENYGLQASIGR